MLAQGPRQQWWRHERRQQRRHGPGQRVGAALERPVGVEETRREQGVALAGFGDQAGEPVVQQLDVGVEEDGHVLAGQFEPGVVRRAEAGVAVEHDHLGAVGGGERCAVVARPRVDDDELRAVAQVALERVEQHGQLGPRVVQHDDDGEAHPAASASSVRRSRAASSQPGIAGAAARRRPRSCSTRSSASASEAASPDRKRSAAPPTVSS